MIPCSPDAVVVEADEALVGGADMGFAQVSLVSKGFASVGFDIDTLVILKLPFLGRSLSL